LVSGDDYDDFEPPERKIDSLLHLREKKKEQRQQEREHELNIPKSETLRKIYDNISFAQKVKDNPLMLKKEYRGYDFKVINLNSFLNLRLYPRSIYTTDKLLRIVAVSRYEQLKKHIQKKRAVPMNMLWIVLIIIGVIMAIVVILFLLPKFTGG
jgi:hypothetical protein